MSSHMAGVVEELAKDYANYANVDLCNQMKTFRDTIEDIMTRLEEFQSIITMVQSESEDCLSQHIPKIRGMQSELNSLCKRVDALEHVIATANVNLCTLEAAVETAEAELGVSDRVFGMLNPLSFFKKTQEPVISNRLTPFESPVIYRTDDYFEKE